MSPLPFNPVAMAAAIVGGLIVAALIAWIRKPRLVVLLPRSFSYSQITDRGQLVEISILNRGFKTEENIDVVLSNTLTYQLVGSNTPDAKVSGNKIQVPRVGPSDEVAVLLLVEPGTFKLDDITQCLSKETKGKTVGKLEDVPPTGPQRIAIVAGVVLVPTLLYGMTFALEGAFKLVEGISVHSRTDEKSALELHGWRVPWFHVGRSKLLEEFRSGTIAVKIGTPARAGEIVSMPVQVENKTSNVLKATISMTNEAPPQTDEW